MFCRRPVVRDGRFLGCSEASKADAFPHDANSRPPTSPLLVKRNAFDFILPRVCRVLRFRSNAKVRPAVIKSVPVFMVNMDWKKSRQKAMQCATFEFPIFF